MIQRQGEVDPRSRTRKKSSRTRKSSEFEQDAELSRLQLRREGFGFTLVELLVVIAIIALLVSAILPAVNGAREAARRSNCMSHMGRIAQALNEYELANGAFPPGVENPAGPIVNLPEGNHQNWIGLLLPYLDEQTTFGHIDRTISVYAAKHDQVRALALPVLRCPTDSSLPDFPVMSSYAGVHHDVEAPIDADNRGLLFLTSHVQRDEITDGSANTLVAGEKRNLGERDLGWLSGTRATLRNTGTPLNHTDPHSAWRATDNRTLPSDAPADAMAKTLFVGGLGSEHPGGAIVAFADGRVQLLDESIDFTTLKQLGNRRDGQLLNRDYLEE